MSDNSELAIELKSVYSRQADQRESRVVSGGQLIDAQECAERLGVTYQTLLRAVKCGNIPAVMVQSSYRFHWPTVVATQDEL